MAGPRAEEYPFCASPGPAAYRPQGFADPSRHPAAPAPSLTGRPTRPPVGSEPAPGGPAPGAYHVAGHPGRPAAAMRCARERSAPAAVFGRGARVLLVGAAAAAGRQGLVFNDMRATPYRDWH